MIAAVARLLRRRAPARPAFAPLPAPTPVSAQPRPTYLRPGDAFTPTRPKTGSRRLVGRRAEKARVIAALLDDHAHVVLYAERGRGKTSLSNLVIEALRQDGIIVARHTCEAGSTFDTIIQGLCQDLPPALFAGSGGEGCEQALPPPPLRPRDVVELPGRLTCRSLVCVVDEFDRVLDEPTRIRFADTIKQLSDSGAGLQFLLVGVSENLDQILGQHPSIQRNVVGIHLPLFTDLEVSEAIAKGARESGFTFPPDVVARIVLVARGMPTVAQLLGLRLTQAASARGATAVCHADVDATFAAMVEQTSPRLLSAYAALTDHGRDAEMARALRRVATAPQDRWGRLRAVPDQAQGGQAHPSSGADPATPGVLLAGSRIGAPCWDRILKAGVLLPCVPGSGLFAFGDRPLLQHVLLLASCRDLASSTPAATPKPATDRRP